MTSSHHSVRRRNIRKSQSDVGMRTTTNDHLFLEGVEFCQTAETKLKRHYSEQAEHIDDDDEYKKRNIGNDDGENRKRNKENNEEVPRVNRAQTEGWLRVRNHVVRNNKKLDYPENI